MAQKYTGWGVRGRPFTEKEYKKSSLYKRLKMSYTQYLKIYSSRIRLKENIKRKKKTRKRTRTYYSPFWGY